MNLTDARTMAQNFRAYILPFCACADIAGGVRRGKQDPHDIEIVCVPLSQHPKPEFGQKGPVHANMLDPALYQAEQDHKLRRDHGADKYRLYQLYPDKWGVNDIVSVAKLDLFIVTPATWAVQFVIRTGPADFSHWLVTPQSKGGALPKDWQVLDGRLWNNGVLVPTPTEESVFEVLGLPWMEPSKRVARWGNL